MIVLVTGGSGCGKSTWAEALMDRIAEGPRIYIATMQVYDDESVRRVARHREKRAGHGYTTVECSQNLQSAFIPPDCCVLLEDLPNLVAGEMFGGGDIMRILPALKKLAIQSRHLVMVTNNVFSDGVAYAPSTEAYLHALAQVDHEAAQLADSVVEVVYSIPIALKGGLPCI